MNRILSLNLPKEADLALTGLRHDLGVFDDGVVIDRAIGLLQRAVSLSQKGLALVSIDREGKVVDVVVAFAQSTESLPAAPE